MTEPARHLGTIVVIPARDESARVASTVRTVAELPGVELVVVVDDGSSDGTAEIARAAGAMVLRSQRNLGKGGAVEGALGRLPVAEVYAFVDADVTDTAGGIAPLLDAIRTGVAELAIGRLPPSPSGGFGLVKRIARWLIRASCGFDATEPLSGQRVLTADVLTACRPLARGFGLETAMTIDAVRAGCRVAEIDVAMSHRATHRDLAGFVHRARQGLDIVAAGAVRLARPR